MHISNYHDIDNYHRNESELTAKINRSWTNYLILINSLSKIIAACSEDLFPLGPEKNVRFNSYRRISECSSPCSTNAEKCHNLFFLREWRWALRSNAAFKNDDSVVF